MQFGLRTSQSSGPEDDAAWFKDCTDQRNKASCSLVKGLHRPGIAPMEMGIAPVEMGIVPVEQGIVPVEQGIVPVELGDRRIQCRKGRLVVYVCVCVCCMLLHVELCIN